MYKRTYPPRSTPVPDNYSGVALLQQEEGAPSLQEENASAEPMAKQEPLQEPIVTEAEKERQGTAEPAPQGAAAWPPSLQSADMLLLAVAALMAQNGQSDNELLMVLLFLLISE